MRTCPKSSREYCKVSFRTHGLRCSPYAHAQSGCADDLDISGAEPIA
jgi:hypothetical protein